MKTTQFLVGITPLLTLWACAGGGVEPGGAGGAPGSGGVSAGGAPAMGGSSAGGQASGGSAAGGASGGSSSGGAASGGSAAGPSGGATNAGGSNAVGGGASESGGAASGGEPGIDPDEVVGELDGFLYRGECNGGNASFECPVMGCSGGVLDAKSNFTIGGAEGSFYEVTLHVYGVVELRADYKGGTRRQGTKSNAQSNQDFLYEGGSYTPGAGYNVYGLTVSPAVPNVPATGGANHYFLNARDSSPEGHEVYALDYEVKIPVGAQSQVTFQAYDPNCLQIMNNSETVRPQGSGTGPNGSLVLSQVEQAEPPPMDFMQPLSTGGRTGQWIFVDVVEVTSLPSP